MQVLKVTCSTSVNVYGKKYRNLASPSSTRTTQQYNNTSDEHQLYHWYLLTKLTTYGSTHSTTSRQTTSTSQDSTTTLQSNGLNHDTERWNHYITVGPRTINHLQGWHHKLNNQLHNYTKLTQTCSSLYRNCKTYRPLTKSDSSSMPLVENARPGNSNTAAFTQDFTNLKRGSNRGKLTSTIIYILHFVY